MKKFMDQDFLLESETAKILFHEVAENAPIFDFHNHLTVREIYEDKQMDGITSAWLGFDHYKWRVMRANGVNEKYITGDASAYEKFEQWAKTMPSLFGNPLYHWTHLELQRYFNVQEPLNEESCERIYKNIDEQIRNKSCSVRNLLLNMNVKACCTTDDPCDDLRYHKALRDEKFEIKVLPSFRADKAIHIEKDTFIPYLKQLGETVGYSIDSYAKLEKAILERMHYFHEVGGRFADHGLDEMLYLYADENEVEEIFTKKLKGTMLTKDEIRKFHGRIQTRLGKEYHQYNWVMQLHIGPMRNNSTRNLKKLGVDAGFDSMGDATVAQDLSRFLDSMDCTDELPKTILYTLNPKDNIILGSMAGNFQDGITPGKIQYGPAWWFNDHKEGMIDQMNCLASVGLLSRFVGMLTDSRSFLSFPRHEYFRRLLCNEVAKAIEQGEYPNDMKFAKKMIEDICYNNIVAYANIEG